MSSIACLPLACVVLLWAKIEDSSVMLGGIGPGLKSLTIRCLRLRASLEMAPPVPKMSY